MVLIWNVKGYYDVQHSISAAPWIVPKEFKFFFFCMMITDVENVHETQYQGKLPIEKLLTIQKP